MITYTLEKRSGKPLYELLYEKIRTDIIDGRLTAGERLPSKRALASQCGVSVITVENAYAQLMAEGFLTSKPRSGFFVSDVFPAEYMPDRTQRIRENDRAAADSGSGKPDGGMQIRQPDAATAQAQTQNLDVAEARGHISQAALFADFTSNAIPPSSFPFSVWSKLMRQTLSENQEQLLERAPSEGIYALRAAIADYLRQFRGFTADPAQIVIGAGTEYLYGLLMQLFGQQTVVAVEEPGYRKVSRVCASNGAMVRHIPVDEQGMDVSMLRESDASVIHISPGHHFPTGVVMPIGRRMALLEWARQREGRYIIEDDYDSEFRMTGRPVPTLAGIDHSDSVIYMNTFSKSLSQTIRISYMVLPYPLLERYRRELNFYACTVSNFEQYTLAKFISGGYFEKHINRMRNYYRGVRDGLLEEIALRGDKTRVREEHAGLHFLLDVPADCPDTELTRRARAQGIAVSCLSGSYSDPAAAPQHVLVMNYSALQKERTQEAVRRLYACIVSGRNQ